MSTIEATQVLSSATNIAFFVSVFNHTNTAILSLADMGITQAMIDDEKFDLEGGIEDFLYNWAHDQIETTVQLSPLAVKPPTLGGGYKAINTTKSDV